MTNKEKIEKFIKEIKGQSEKLAAINERLNYILYEADEFESDELFEEIEKLTEMQMDLECEIEEIEIEMSGESK